MTPGQVAYQAGHIHAPKVTTRPPQGSMPPGAIKHSPKERTSGHAQN